MTVSELIQHLSEHDPNMEVFVTTKENTSSELISFDYELYAAHGKYRGVYIEVEE